MSQFPRQDPPLLSSLQKLLSGVRNSSFCFLSVRNQAFSGLVSVAPVFMLLVSNSIVLSPWGQTGVSIVRNSHFRVWKRWGRTLRCEWLAEVSLGSPALFSCCCTVEQSRIYCIFFFEARLGLHLLQYCDDFMKIVNCTAFTSRICSFEFWFHIKICIFFPQTGRSRCTAPTFCPFAAIFFPELWLNYVNKYYGIKIWMSLQKLIWMS